MDLFSTVASTPHSQAIGQSAWLLHGFALKPQAMLLAELRQVLQQAPLQRMTTPNGIMPVKTSSCGSLGWVSDRHGYRYSPVQPANGEPWPPMPDIFSELAQKAAKTAGFSHFQPDACLINRYQPGSKMGLHQDKDEEDFSQPIVSVSLGIPATFLFGGLKRRDPVLKIPLQHGDVVVWGGVDRLRYHGVMPVIPDEHPLLGRIRLNLTFRKAGK